MREKTHHKQFAWSHPEHFIGCFTVVWTAFGGWWYHISWSIHFPWLAWKWVSFTYKIHADAKLFDLWLFCVEYEGILETRCNLESISTLAQSTHSEIQWWIFCLVGGRARARGALTRRSSEVNSYKVTEILCVFTRPSNWAAPCRAENSIGRLSCGTPPSVGEAGTSKISIKGPVLRKSPLPRLLIEASGNGTLSSFFLLLDRKFFLKILCNRSSFLS